MKLRRLFLGVAIVALMAACGGKETATPTEAVAEATPASEVAEATPEAPAEEVKAEEAPAQEQKKADPCEAKVKAFEKSVNELAEAYKTKDAKGAKGLKEYGEKLAAAGTAYEAVKECNANADFQKRIQNAFMEYTNLKAKKK